MAIRPIHFLSDCLLCRIFPTPVRTAAITTGNSKTKTATAIRNLPRYSEQCAQVLRSHNLWEKLKSYYPGGGGVTPPEAPVPYPSHPLHNILLPADLLTNRNFHRPLNLVDRANTAFHNAQAMAVQNLTTTTWVPGQTYQLTAGDQQYKAIVDLWGHFLLTVNRPPAVIPSEPAMQDEVLVQILEVLNLLTRYDNFQHLSPPDMNIPFDGGAASFYPQWGRACAGVHRNRNIDPKTDYKKAGFPDFLFYRIASPEQTPAVVEVKTMWAYPDALVDDICSVEVADSITGKFNFLGESKAHALIRQIWGELVFFSATWGFWVNGSCVFIFVRTGRNQITLSDRKPLTSPDVIHALAGMTFAAMDTGLRPWLVDWLCPYNDRRADWVL